MILSSRDFENSVDTTPPKKAQPRFVASKIAKAEVALPPYIAGCRAASQGDLYAGYHKHQK
jgi:hypothetical protein